MKTTLRGLKFLALAGCLLLLPAAAPSETNHAAIPFDQIGAVAGKQYSGDGLAVAARPDGARLNCAFQRLDAQVTVEGLWLNSTEDGAKGEPFRIRASAVGRESSTALPQKGQVSVSGQVAQFIRPGLTEEYSVSVDGVRQDFVIEQRPDGTGPMRMELEVDGAEVERMADGTRLVLADGGRKLVYSRLKAEDARGKELNARLEVMSANRLAVVVEDSAAEYPVRIDPTFSDANWVSLGGVPGVVGEVYAAVVDSSGNLYIGGSFTVAGNVIANNVAEWNGSSWSALGSGIGDEASYPGVTALAVSGNTLYAGGFFTTAGGVTATNIAQWNGSSWSALGSGISGGDGNSPPVSALAVSGTNLYAGGDFTTAGGVSATNIAEWNGSSWSALGSGMNGYVVLALAVSGNTLYVGGVFTTAGGVAATNIAQWNGSSWSALGSGIGGGVDALAVSGSTLYVGGEFSTAGGVSATNIAQWNGSSWSALGSGMNFSVNALAVSGTNLYAGGYFSTAGGVPANYIAQWNGSAWSALGSGIYGGVEALAVSGNTVYAGGYFTTAGGVAADGIAKWNGSSWSALGSGMNNTVFALAVSGNTVYAGGTFTTAGGVPANYIAQWNGSAWSALGSGMSGGYGPYVAALAVSGNTLFAGGYFTNAGGVAATNIAQWNGSAWSALGSGMNNQVRVLAVSGTNLFAGGWFTTAGAVAANYVAQWNGSSWSALGSGIDGYNAIVYALAVSGNTLYVGGEFSTAGGVAATNIAQWNGSSWSALGSSLSGGGSFEPFGDCLACDSSGNLYTDGDTINDYIIAQWNGSAWSALGSGIGDDYSSVNALAVSGNTLYAGGYFTTAGGVTANYIAQWNGSAWSALGSGIGDEVEALAVSGDNNLYVGGRFTTAGTNVSAYVAEALFSQSSYNLALTKLGAGTNVITGLGTPNYAYALDLATNLAPPINWMPQATNTLTYQSFVFTNTSASPQGFYRTRYVPQ